MRRYLLAFAAVITTLFSAIVHAEIEISITGGRVAPVPIAIVPFQAEQEAPLDVSDIVESDLRYTGLFAPFPRADMLETPSTVSQINYQSWSAVGIEHLVIGQVRRRDAGGWVVEFRLMNVGRQQVVAGFEIPVSNEGLRHAAHKISDLIYEQLTGHKGVFNTRIAYVMVEGGVKNLVSKLVVADADGNAPVTLLKSREPIMSPTWSPDAQQMAYVAFERGSPKIFLQNLSTGKLQRLTQKEGINSAPAFSPNGKQLAVVLSYQGNPEIYILDIATRRLRRMTNDPSIDTEPTWAPDGQSIVFTSDRAGSPHLYQLSVAGGEPRRLTFQGKSNSDASFSPDGRSLTMVQRSGNGYRIAVYSMKTGTTRVLSDGPNDESPSFAPNGVVIIYSTKGKSGTELATISVDNGVRQGLTESGQLRDPAWSPFTQ